MGNASSIGRDIRADLSKTIRDVMLLAADNVANATPVDTGFASASWILSTGQPSAEVGGSPEAVSHAAQDTGIANLQHYDVARDGKVFLVNNVFYLQFLDRGWSQQAPPGFVAMAFNGAARRAAPARRAAVRKMLQGMAHHAFLKTY